MPEGAGAARLDASRLGSRAEPRPRPVLAGPPRRWALVGRATSAPGRGRCGRRAGTARGAPTDGDAPGQTSASGAGIAAGRGESDRGARALRRRRDLMAATKTAGSATLEDATAAFAAEGCSSPTTWGNGPGDTYGRHAHGYHKVLFCLEGSIVFHTDDGDVTLARRRPARPGAGDARTRRPSDRAGAAASRPPGEGRVPRRPALLQRARRHRHRTYGDARALARQPDPSLELVLFHSRFAAPSEVAASGGCASTGSRSSRLDPDAVPAVGPARPARRFPPSLDDADIVHATNPAAVLPSGGDQRLVVTVHDLAFEHFPELFPRDVALLYRLGLRAAVRRADAILTPSRNTAEDVCRARTSTRGAPRGAARGVARRRARGRGRGARPAEGAAAVRAVRRHARAAQEPGAAGARVPAGRGDRRPALARAGGAARLAPRAR